MNPKNPIFILSKGRWESRLTSKAFERMNVPYRMIIEEQEFDKYSQYINKEKLIVLEKKYQEDYNPCDEFGMQKSKGSGPARNFAWDIAEKEGFRYHWIIDDNIYAFYRLNNNIKLRVYDGTIFRCMEDFVDRYENVVMAGPNYHNFAPHIVRLKQLYGRWHHQADMSKLNNKLIKKVDLKVDKIDNYGMKLISTKTGDQ